MTDDPKFSDESLLNTIRFTRSPTYGSESPHADTPPALRMQAAFKDTERVALEFVKFNLRRLREIQATASDDEATEIATAATRALATVAVEAVFGLMQNLYGGQFQASVADLFMHSCEVQLMACERLMTDPNRQSGILVEGDEVIHTAPASETKN